MHRSSLWAGPVPVPAPALPIRWLGLALLLLLAGCMVAWLARPHPPAAALPPAEAEVRLPPPFARLLGRGAPGPALPAAAAPGLLAPATGGYALDLGVILVPEQAEALAARLAARGLPVQMLAVPGAGGVVWTHLRSVPFAADAGALAGAEQVAREFGLAASLVPQAAAAPR
ncbi:SPOR domain-containing protein [Siccirubricoccus phaeus]|uniref:SPOR domain-containing protein n=1 Tax=Siccirubricoccus phaeus TaxID=2595053 RepID=UPI00165C0938|nr:SPOR domain-containing protein [Siccirubricoccus phaeus]